MGKTIATTYAHWKLGVYSNAVLFREAGCDKTHVDFTLLPPNAPSFSIFNCHSVRRPLRAETERVPDVADCFRMSFCSHRNLSNTKHPPHVVHTYRCMTHTSDTRPFMRPIWNEGIEKYLFIHLDRTQQINYSCEPK